MSISVVIPCYNNAAHLAETLASVRAQSRKPLEVIVVDDASTDDSAAVVRGFEGVRLLGLERNSGTSLARNTGLFGARGDMVAWLDGDRKSTRLNSSHGYISYAVFCLKKKKK